MGKSKREYRRNATSGYDPRDFAVYESADATPSKRRRGNNDDSRDYSDRKPRFNNRQRSPRRTFEPDPVAYALAEEFASQAREFIEVAPQERSAVIGQLFDVGSYPAEIDGEELEHLLIWVVDRNCRLNRDDPEKLRRMQASAVVTDKETGKLAYYISAFITPDENYTVRVTPLDERGPNTSKAATISSWKKRELEAESAE